MIHSIKVGNTTENITVNMSMLERSTNGYIDFVISKYMVAIPSSPNPFNEHDLYTIMVADDGLGTNALVVFTDDDGTRSSGVRIGEIRNMSNNANDAAVSVMMQDGNNMDITLYSADSITAYRGGANNDTYYNSVVENIKDAAECMWRVGTYDYDKPDLDIRTYSGSNMYLNSAGSMHLDATSIAINTAQFTISTPESTYSVFNFKEYQEFTIQWGSENFIEFAQAVFTDDHIKICSPNVTIGEATSSQQYITVYGTSRMQINGAGQGIYMSGRFGSNTKTTANGLGTVISGSNIAITGTSTSNMFASTGIIKGLESTATSYIVPSMCIIGPGYGYLGPSYDQYNTTQFMIVTGSSSSRKNALRVANHKVYLNQALSSSGAGLTEMFEWADGNEDNEDRVGHFVTLVGEKIRYAEPSDDYVLGAVDPLPLLIGDDDEVWKGMHKKDVFGRVITEKIFVPAEMDEEGNLLWEDHYEEVPVTGEDFVPDTEYKARSSRKEYATISSKGKVVLIDDGTCIVDKFATVGPGGIATHSDDNVAVRVMKRIDDTHIKVFIDASFLIKH